VVSIFVVGRVRRDVRDRFPRCVRRPQSLPCDQFDGVREQFEIEIGIIDETLQIERVV